MGGLGSGRRHQGGKDTTNHYRSLDIRRLQREGFLEPDRSFGWDWFTNSQIVVSIQIHTKHDCVILDYRHQRGHSEQKTQYYRVMLNWTECHFGGQRAWFLCPVKDCGRRVAILYLSRSGIFACRHCCLLTYLCQQESPVYRVIRRADKIRDRLKWHRGIFIAPGGKPKGMDWSTYLRLTKRHDAFVDKSLEGITRLLDRMQRRLE